MFERVAFFFVEFLRLRGFGQPFERDAHAVVVALPSIDAQQQAQRFGVFGIARERAVQEFE